jgi:hypothetical protein
VISTPIGAEGIDHTEGLNILIARNAIGIRRTSSRWTKHRIT